MLHKIATESKDERDQGGRLREHVRDIVGLELQFPEDIAEDQVQFAPGKT